MLLAWTFTYFRVIKVTPNTFKERDTVNVPRFFYVRIYGSIFLLIVNFKNYGK